MTDIGKIGSSVLGIAGMGIGLGLLAHTANNVTRMSDRLYDDRRRGYGRMDGSQRGYRTGGRGRNRTSSCRHPRIRDTRSRARSRTYKPRFYNPW